MALPTGSRRRRRPVSRRRPGFTLIELLVVVVILSLLVIILLPVVQQAFERARATLCQQHLSEIGKGLQSHVLENKRVIPAMTRRQFVGGSHDGRDTGLEDEMWSLTLVRQKRLTMSPLPDTNQPVPNNVFYCPSGLPELTDPLLTRSQTDPNGMRGVADFGSHPAARGYIYNWYGINGHDSDDPEILAESPFPVLPQFRSALVEETLLRSPDQLKPDRPPSKLVAIFDGQGILDGHPDTRIAARHHNRTQVNLLMLSGHVESAQASALPQNDRPDLRFRDFSPRWRW